MTRRGFEGDGEPEVPGKPEVNRKTSVRDSYINLVVEFESTWFEESEVEHCDIRSHVREALKSHMLISGFTWTAALGHYQGNWQDEDIQNPISTQLILYDGENFTFGAYQLNTLGFELKINKSFERYTTLAVTRHSNTRLNFFAH